MLIKGVLQDLEVGHIFIFLFRIKFDFGHANIAYNIMLLINKRYENPLQ